MSSFDFVLLLLLGLLAWRGWSRGIITQITSVVGLVVGGLAALRGSALLAPAIPLQDPLRHYVAMVLIFVGVMIAAYFIGRIVRGAVNLLYLGWLDHLIGLVLGIIKSVLIAVVIIFACVMVSEATARWATQSFAGPFGVAIIKATEKAIPPDVCQRLHEQLAKFDAKVMTISDGASAEWTLDALRQGVADELEKARTTLGTDVTNAVTQEVTNRAGEAVAKESPALAGWFTTPAPALSPTPATTSASNAFTASNNEPEQAPTIVNELKSFVSSMVTPAPPAAAPMTPLQPLTPVAAPPVSASSGGGSSFWDALTPVAAAPAPPPNPAAPKPTAPPLFDPSAWADALKR